MKPVREKAIKDITEDADLEAIIKRSKVCHVAMIDTENRPYLLAFNFGYANRTIYLHCTKEGKKIDVLRNNNNVCVYFDCDHDVFARNEEVACSWRMRYRSVLADGKAEIVEDYEQKLEGLKLLMTNYSFQEFKFSPPAVNNVLVIKIKIDKWSGRSFEY